MERETLLLSGRAFDFFLLRNEITIRILQKHTNVSAKAMLLPIRKKIKVSLKRSTDDQKWG